MKEALRDLLSTVETVATEAGVVSGLVDSITASMNQMESRAQTVITFCPAIGQAHFFNLFSN